jgi:uncharacterized protein (DUF2147 family)
MNLRKILITLGLAITTASTFAQMTPVGLWRNIDDKTGEARAEIRITARPDGALTGVIERALIRDAEPLCTECTDERKGKPKVGMEIIRGARKTDGQDVWEGGKILDPENGREYTLKLTPTEEGKKLQVRGYIGFFFRTQTWLRVQ